MNNRPAEMDATDVTDGRTVTLVDMIRIPLRRWVLPLAGALLGLLAGIGYLLLPASYEAVAVVAVRPVVTDPFSYPGPGADRVVNMTVENGLATGTDVVAAVATASGQSPTMARAGLTVEMPAGSQVLRFRYRTPAPDKAIAGANAAGSSYLTVRKAIYQGQRDAIVASYDASLKGLATERDAIRKTLPTVTPETGGNSASVTAQLDRLRGLDDRLSDLTSRRAVAVAVDVSPGTVTRVAAPPVASDRDIGLLIPLTALVGGALFGAVAAFGLEALNRRVRSASDAAAVTRLPILAELHGRRFRADRERRAADLRYLALAIVGQLGPVPHRRIVLISVKPGDRTGQVAVQLALALAEQGNTVRWKDLSAEAPAARASLLAATDDPAPEVTEPVAAPAPSRKGDKTPVITGEPATAEVTPGARPVPGSNGRIWLDAPPQPEETMVTVVRAGPAERDDRGVREALEAAAVLLVRRDQIKVSELDQLAGVLRLTGARALGVVLVSGHD
ncbi:hypothetical protein ACWKSP_28210 [Micromonosporaceae bacterium Da 78-11]